VGGLYV